tara:strand:+ start:202 stop:399 length:198 start_codon:yes stop_codon:yes gene_type:complete
MADGFLMMTPEEAASALEKAGWEDPLPKIQEDIQGGAPVTDDGRMDLVAYLAWLIDGETGSTTSN